MNTYLIIRKKKFASISSKQYHDILSINSFIFVYSSKIFLLKMKCEKRVLNQSILNTYIFKKKKYHEKNFFTPS